MSLDLVVGSDRECFKRSIPTNGDWSLLLRYRGKEAYVASFEEKKLDALLVLELTQMQGGRKGYRVMTAMAVVGFLTDQIRGIVEHPESPYDLLVMPNAIFINGVLDATEAAIRRYEAAALRLGMEYSDKEHRFVRKLKNVSQ